MRDNRSLPIAGVGGEADEEQRARFQWWLHRRSIDAARGLARLVAHPSVERIADLGCGVGTYAAELLEACPSATAVLVDRPNGGRAVAEFMGEAGLSDRAEFIGGDFLRDDFGDDFDLIVISNVLHCQSPRDNKLLLRRAAAALRPGGRLVVKDLAIAEDRSGPTRALRFGAMMALFSDDGAVHRPSEVSEWLEEAGLQTGLPTPIPEATNSYALVARREAARVYSVPGPLVPTAPRFESRLNIIGGGIAGLASAIRLREAGVEATVFERAPVRSRKGLAFIIMSNGMRALDEMGLGDVVRASGRPIEHAMVRTPAGEVLVGQPIGDAVCIQRSFVTDLLRNQLPHDAVLDGMEFTGFDRASDGSVDAVRFANGATARGEIFVGADGVRSRVRAELYPDHSLSPVRIKELVAVVRAPMLSASLGNTFLKTVDPGGGLAVGVAPCGGEHVVWFIQYDSQRYEINDTSTAGRREFAETLVGSWAAPIGYLIKETDFSKSYIWHTTDMEPLPTFHRDNVLLAGDAAHTFLTFTSQGVSCALEDAIVLGRVAERFGTTTRSLRVFDETRRRQVRRYLQSGRELAERFLDPGQFAGQVQIPLVQ